MSHLPAISDSHKKQKAVIRHSEPKQRLFSETLQQVAAFKLDWVNYYRHNYNTAAWTVKESLATSLPLKSKYVRNAFQNGL